MPINTKGPEPFKIQSLEIATRVPRTNKVSANLPASQLSRQ